MPVSVTLRAVVPERFLTRAFELGCAPRPQAMGAKGDQPDSRPKMPAISTGKQPKRAKVPTGGGGAF